MKTVTVEVDYDKTSKRCHKPGATSNGLCFPCILSQQFIIINRVVEKERSKNERNGNSQ